MDAEEKGLDDLELPAGAETRNENSGRLTPNFARGLRKLHVQLVSAIFRTAWRTPTGDRGQQVAAAWLERERGFTIVARNWRSPHDRRDESDLVARDGDALVFVEVKTRAAGALVPGYYAVDERKSAWCAERRRPTCAGCVRNR